jgi:hypothetical protein
LALCAAAFATSAGSDAFANDCASQLDRIEQALEQGDVDSDQMDTLRADLAEARRLADDGDEEGCSPAAAKLQSAMLKIEGIDHDSLCGRTQSEDDIGEADMAGNQDVQAALQTSCEVEE